MNLPRCFVILSVFAASVLPLSMSAQDRMPPIPADKMTEAQKKANDLLTSTPRGASGAGGPFTPLLRSPELMNRLQTVGAYLRFNNSIPQKFVEMTIIMIARQWTQQYEWAIHQPLAIKAGLKPEIASAIAESRHPSGMAEDEAMVWDFNNELAQTKTVSDTTYARVVKKFGEQGVIDLTGINGYYTTLAMLMSVGRTPGPSDSTAPTLVPFAR